MAEADLASAVALPDLEPDDVPSHAGMKRTQKDGGDDDSEQEKKRPRTSPGKSSPAPTTKDSQDAPPQHISPNSESRQPAQKAEQSPKESRRKTSIIDEKQRSKRLFGALLGDLNQPRDRTSKKRQEIESRRKAELQRQDDERLEDKQRRLEQLAQKRKREQRFVDKENMRIRHDNLLDRAHFLQTTAQPPLLYLPWTLRPDEEDRLNQQIDDAQAQIDREVTAYEEDRESKSDGTNGSGPNRTRALDETDAVGLRHGRKSDTKITAEQTNDKSKDVALNTKEPNEEVDINVDADRKRSPQQATSPPPVETMAEELGSEGAEVADGHDDEVDNDGDHVVDGDEDMAIY